MRGYAHFKMLNKTFYWAKLIDRASEGSDNIDWKLMVALKAILYINSTGILLVICVYILTKLYVYFH